MRWPGEEKFWLGANLPWLTYGCDFGANLWQPEGGVAQPGRRATLRVALERLAGQGTRTVRWFMLADGRAGIVESPEGRIEGLDDHVFRDADAALEELERTGLQVIFVLFDFHWFMARQVAEGVRLGGRSAVAIDADERRRLIGRVVTPLVERYGRHPSVLAWDVLNEPEWVTRRRWGLPRRGLVPRAAMRAFIRDVVDVIHRHGSQAATAGSASACSLRLVEGLGLDVYQVHWYDHLDPRAPLAAPVADLGLDRAVILGEFPTRGSQRSPEDIVRTAREAGYAGALAWSALAGDEASDAGAMARSLRLGGPAVGNPGPPVVD
jgi:hypothetical protein